MLEINNFSALAQFASTFASADALPTAHQHLCTARVSQNEIEPLAEADFHQAIDGGKGYISAALPGPLRCPNATSRRLPFEPIDQGHLQAALSEEVLSRRSHR